MPKGVRIPEALCWTVVRLASCRWTRREIEVFTKVSKRSQRRILKRYRETGDVVEQRVGPNMRGRNPDLGTNDILVRTFAL